MVPHSSLLLALVDLIEVIPSPPGQGRAGARGGRPPIYSDRLFVKALVIMLVRNVWTVSGLLAILEQPTWEMAALRARLTEHGRFPTSAPGGCRACRDASIPGGEIALGLGEGSWRQRRAAEFLVPPARPPKQPEVTCA